MTTKATIKNGDITLPITRTGEGQKLIFFNGGGATQVVWKRVIKELKGQYEIITFDFRSHGNASDSDDHSFKAFLSDAEAVMNTVGSHKPIVIGWSFGADLALAYAAAHPGTLRGLVIVDGAVPISKPITIDEIKMRREINRPIMKFSMLLMRLTPYAYRLSGDDLADTVIELNRRRQDPQQLDAYAKANCPITVLLATKALGDENTSDEEKAREAKRKNEIWREGAKRLSAKYPQIPIKWIDGTHKFPLEKPVKLAEVIDEFAEGLKSIN